MSTATLAATAARSVKMHTPWGTADEVRLYCDGIVFASTPSHGGIKVAPDLNARIPAYMRRGDGWYEEDCDWCIPFAVFESLLRAGGNIGVIRTLDAGDHLRTLKSWHPDAYEKFTAQPIKPGESYTRDREAFDEEGAAVGEVAIAAENREHGHLSGGDGGVPASERGDADQAVGVGLLVPGRSIAPATAAATRSACCSATGTPRRWSRWSSSTTCRRETRWPSTWPAG